MIHVGLANNFKKIIHRLSSKDQNQLDPIVKKFNP